MSKKVKNWSNVHILRDLFITSIKFAKNKYYFFIFMIIKMISFKYYEIATYLLILVVKKLEIYVSQKLAFTHFHDNLLFFHF